MDVRIISLGCLSSTLPKPAYQALRQGNELSIEGISDAPQLYGMPPLQRLVFQTQHEEWSNSICKVFSHELNKFAECIKVEHLIRSGPWRVLSPEGEFLFPFDTNKELDKYDASLLENSLKPLALKIIKRKTLLVIPNDQESSQPYLESDLLNKIADELIHNLGNESPYRDIALIPLRSRSQSSTLTAGLFDAVMNALFCRTTQLNFASRLHQKEGPLLIEGATGTGKSQAASLIANTLKKDLIEINLAALSNELIESRIRGYKKGAFTGAEKDTPGFFEEADGKVLFLDELQSTALTSQTQLLDLLSAVSNRVRVGRIGGDSTRREYTVKVILATNRPAKDLLSEGVLREDLFHRIRDVVSFKNLNQLLKQDDYQELIKKLLTLYRWKSLAPLDADIPEVRTELIFPSIDPGIFSQIRQANWPGNFRQFERFS